MRTSAKPSVSKRQRKKGLILLTFMIPGLLFYLVFHYAPMYGTLIAFQDYNPFLGFAKSPWVGFKHFDEFFHSLYFWRLLKNTFLLSFENIIFSFPMPIIFALMMYEVKHNRLRSAIQSLSYFPYFISWVVFGGILIGMLSPEGGIVNEVLMGLGLIDEPVSFVSDPKYFWGIVIVSSLIKGLGWGAIIYIAAIAGIINWGFCHGITFVSWFWRPFAAQRSFCAVHVSVRHIDSCCLQ